MQVTFSKNLFVTILTKCCHFPKSDLNLIFFCNLMFQLDHSIYIRTVICQCLLSTLLIQFTLVYGPFEQSNRHSTPDFCPKQSGRKRRYHFIREAKSLLSYYIYFALSRLPPLHDSSSRTGDSKSIRGIRSQKHDSSRKLHPNQSARNYLTLALPFLLAPRF